MKAKMWPAGNEKLPRSRCAGFTLFEILAVMAIVAVVMSSVLIFRRPDTSSTDLKSVAYMMSSRLKGLRARAISDGAERVAVVDVGRHFVRFEDGRAPLGFDTSIGIVVTAADSERRSTTETGIRFYPNGSSSGGTIKLKRKRKAYEIQVQWLTGRISTNVVGSVAR